jgi:hypothetical protein
LTSATLVGLIASTFPTLSESCLRLVPIGSAAFWLARSLTCFVTGWSWVVASAWVIEPFASFSPTWAAVLTDPATSTHT